MFLSGLGVGGKGDSQFLLTSPTAIGVPFGQKHSYAPINQGLTKQTTKPPPQNHPQNGAKVAQEPPNNAPIWHNRAFWHLRAGGRFNEK
jgi:hypothetical protein